MTILEKYKKIERDLRLGHLPDEEIKRLTQLQEKLKEEASKKLKKDMKELDEHMCNFYDNYCIICGLDGRA